MAALADANVRSRRGFQLYVSHGNPGGGKGVGSMRLRPFAPTVCPCSRHQNGHPGIAAAKPVCQNRRIMSRAGVARVRKCALQQVAAGMAFARRRYGVRDPRETARAPRTSNAVRSGVQAKKRGVLIQAWGTCQANSV